MRGRGEVEGCTSARTQCKWRQDEREGEDVQQRRQERHRRSHSSSCGSLLTGRMTRLLGMLSEKGEVANLRIGPVGRRT